MTRTDDRWVRPEIRIRTDRASFDRNSGFKFVALGLAPTSSPILFLLFAFLVLLLLFPVPVFLFVRNGLRRVDLLFLKVFVDGQLVVVVQWDRTDGLCSESLDEPLVTFVHRFHLLRVDDVIWEKTKRNLAKRLFVFTSWLYS